MPPVFAMPPPEYYRDRNIALGLLALAAAGFVRWTGRRRGERSRRIGLARLTLQAGPAVGLVLGLFAAWKTANPPERLDALARCIAFGVIAGLIGWCFFAGLSRLARDEPAAPPS